MRKIHIQSFALFIVLISTIVFLFSGFKAPEQSIRTESTASKTKPLAYKIQSIKQSGKVFEQRQTMALNNNSQQSAMLTGYLKSFVSLKLERSALTSMLNQKPENVNYIIPMGGNKNMELELYRTSVLTDDFRAGTLSGSGTANFVNYTPGVYYRGIVKGDNESFASLSIFDDFVMAVISNHDGNWNLSSIKDGLKMYTDNYVFYNDVDLLSKRNFTCGVNDEDGRFDKRSNSWQNQGQGNSSMPPQLVKKYFECDYKMYQDYGNNTAAVNNYVTAFFNSCAAMYQQDSINTQIQQIFVWTSPDAYMGLTDNELILKRLGGRLQNSINGDLAHFVSTRTDISGGIAWVGVLCSSFTPGDSSGRYAVSVIDTMLLPFPQYSWVVNVVVHEMGHNLGSNHTHNCSWPGGPIDSCYAIEGGCYSGPLIPRIGTVMSYCHLNASTNLALGFGHYPGDTVRANVLRAPCLTIGITPISTEVPAEYKLSQNYPNPFNPFTVIKFNIAKTGFVKLTVFDITGREVEVLAAEEMKAGVYQAEFDASRYASGLYFYRIQTEGFTDIKKMILIK